MQKLILDYSKWRCGGGECRSENVENILGEGPTQLLNKQGFMCCLGQFSTQLEPSVTPLQLFEEGQPSGLEVLIPILNYINDSGGSDYEGQWETFRDTDLTNDAISINDDILTTPLEKIDLLKKLFAKAHCEIEVINLP